MGVHADVYSNANLFLLNLFLINYIHLESVMVSYKSLLCSNFPLGGFFHEIGFRCNLMMQRCLLKVEMSFFCPDLQT